MLITAPDDMLDRMLRLSTESAFLFEQLRAIESVYAQWTRRTNRSCDAQAALEAIGAILEGPAK